MDKCIIGLCCWWFSDRVRKIKETDWNCKRQAGKQECETRAVSQEFPVPCRFKCPLQKHYRHKSQGPLTSRGILFEKDLHLPYPFHIPGADNLRVRPRIIFKLIWKNGWQLFPTGQIMTNLEKPIIFSVSVFWT